MRKPRAYQLGNGVKTEVQSDYMVRAGRIVSFQLGPYDTRRPLVIDPVLTYSTYLGGSGDDYGLGIAVDSSANAYIVGATSSLNFPILGPLQTVNAGSTDMFVTKLNAAGNALLYSTYIGGSSNEGVIPGASGPDLFGAIVVDSVGNAYITGYTTSGDYPTTPGAFQTVYHGNGDALVTKLNGSGNSLVYSTYLGGSGTDQSGTITLDTSGNVYLAGLTRSADFPATAGAFQTTNPALESSFVAKLNATGTSLVYATFLGGASGFSQANGIAIDSSGNAYVGGVTYSSTFPTTPGAAQTTCNSCSSNLPDGFITKLNATGTGLVYSTYLGGSEIDEVEAITVAPSGIAFVTGPTVSNDFPVTPNAPQPKCASCTLNAQQGEGHDPDIFLSEIRPSGNAVAFSTFWGGIDAEISYGIVLDNLENAYVTGTTRSVNYPLVLPIQSICSCSFNGPYGFVMEMSTNPNIEFSSYLGGSQGATPKGIAADSNRNIYLVGFTASTDFPTIGAFQQNSGGGLDAFVAKIAPPSAAGLSYNPTSISFGNENVNQTSLTQTVLLTNMGSLTMIFNSIVTTGDFAYATPCGSTLGGGGATCPVYLTFTPTRIGTRTGTLSIADTALGSPQVINVSGNGVAPIVNLSAASLTFGNQPLGTTSAPQTITLTNTGNTTLSISSYSISSGFAQTNACGSGLAAGAQCTISVTFSPNSLGTQLGSLTITDDATVTAPVSPQTIALTGTGTAPIVNLSAATLAFGNQDLGTKSSAQTVTVNNTGSAALTITGVTTSGDFAETNTCGGSVAVGASCSVSVTFTPTAIGVRSGTLTITDNNIAVAVGTETVALTGTGVAPVASLAPSIVPF
ncbi:MAG: hypothetical protein DMG22_11565, partial [Acidobacteria bacterium]